MRRPKSRSLSGAIVATLFLVGAGATVIAAGQAAGQYRNPTAASKEGGEDELQEVVVTGSLIKRKVEVGSQLVPTITAQDIQRRGATNATEILKAVSQNQPIEVPNSYTAAGTGLASYASLRSLNFADKGYPFYNEVKAYSLWDLFAAYKHGEAWTVTALVRNLFDTDPPFTNKVQGIGTGYEDRTADPIGRAIGLTVTANFNGQKR